GSVEALGLRLVRLLEGAVAAPDVAIGRLELLSAAERRQLLEEWNATGRALPGGTIVDELAAQAAARPDAVAAVFEDARLSYGELEARGGSSSMRRRRRLGRSPRARRRSRCRGKTSPTSSIPQAQPERPRASPSSMATLCDCSAPPKTCSASTRKTFGRYSILSPST